jgi:hypothetical protein
MPDLGKKYTCYSCGAKFYNLNKPESICPKCGADQKDARSEEAPVAAAPRPPRRSMMIETIPDEGGGTDFEESPQEDEEAREGELDDDDERIVDDRGPQKSEEGEEY